MNEDKNRQVFDRVCALVQIGLGIAALFTSGYTLTKTNHLQDSFNQYQQEYTVFKDEVQGSFNQYQQEYSVFKDDITNKIEMIESNTTMNNGAGDNLSFNDGAVINNNTNTDINNYTYPYDETTSTKTLLIYAQNAFRGEDYEKTVQIYSMAKLGEQPIVNCNLGYMYSNGIYFPADIGLADYYYDKAIEEGSEKARTNKLSCHIRWFRTDSIKLLLEEADRDNERVLDYFVSLFPEKQFKSYEEKKNFVHHQLDDLDLEDYGNYMDAIFYTWEYEGYEIIERAPESTKFVQYEYVRTYDGGGEDGAISAIYKKYERKCINLDILKESFSYIKD